MGTAAYMSPEQARGKVVDKRGDIWGFGCVLYEMLTGIQAFSGETTSDILAAVITKGPDLSEVPKHLRPIVEKCLRRDPKIRWRDIGDVRIALSEASPIEASQIMEEHSGTASPGIAWLIAGVFAIGLTLLAVTHFREKPPESQVLRFSAYPPERVSLVVPALSPDGRRLAFDGTTADGKHQLWVRSMDNLTMQPLAGTEGAWSPFWSPDGRFIGFFGDNKLKKIDASGGPVLTLCEAPDGGPGTWGRNGLIVFSSRARPLYEVSASGGVPAPVTMFDQTRRETGHAFPWFLPDGRHFLYVAVSGGFDVGNATLRIASAPLLGHDSKIVMEASSNVAYAQGHLVFVREGTLMAQPFDLSRLITTEEASPLVENVRIRGRLSGVFSVSETGLLAYQTGGPDRQPLVWFDRNGKQVGTVAESGLFNHPYLSPDEKSAVMSVIDPTTQNADIWVFDLFRTLRTRFTFDPAEEAQAIWSPDGASIVFNSRRRGHLDLYQKPTNGTGIEQLLYADDLDKTPTSWSPDGKFLLYSAVDPKRKTTSNTWVLPGPGTASTEPRPFVFVETGGNGQFSPDGRWVVYQSAEPSQREIYVVPFPAKRVKRQISTAGGVQPRWRRDGREIFYIGLDDRLMAVEVKLKASGLEIAAVQPLFRPLRTGSGIQYDVSADGQRFLAIPPSRTASDEPLTIVQNWLGALKR